MADLIHRVKSKLAIRAHRRVRGLLDGEYASVYHGKSHEFDELRPYVPGDEIKDIDWKATARHGAPLTKQYVAQRKHVLMIVTDTGRNLAAVGADGSVKRDVATLAAGVLGYLALRHGDHVGLYCGDEDGVHHVPARGTESHLERVLARMHEAPEGEGARSDLDRILDTIARTVRRRMILVVIGDDEPIGEGRKRTLRRLAAQHELLWISVGDADPTDAAFADRAMFDVDDGRFLPDYLRNDPGLRREFAASVALHAAETEDALDGIGVASVRIAGVDDAVTQVLRLIEDHNRTGKRAHAG